MKIKIISLIIIICLLTGCSDKSNKKALKFGENIIKAVSYNTCCINTKKGFTVSERAPLLIEILKKYDPDIIGFQEFEKNWENCLVSVLKDEYDIVYKHRALKETECTPIFYKKEKYELLNEGYFWLSETPEKQSKSWSAENFRICSWVKLKIKTTNKIFFFFNTHFDFSEKAQSESAKLIKNKVSEICEEYPVIISGDFNMSQSSIGYNIMSKNFQDVNTANDPTNTFKPYTGEKTSLIDYIFVSPDITPLNYKVMTDNIDGKYASDHFGIYSEIAIKN